jgi:hypothetical protein
MWVFGDTRNSVARITDEVLPSGLMMLPIVSKASGKRMGSSYFGAFAFFALLCGFSGRLRACG